MSPGAFGPSALPLPNGPPSSTMAQSSSVPTAIDAAPATSTASITFPPCAQSCLAEATSSLPCGASDSECLCLHASAVQSSVDTCLTASGACSAADETSATLYYNNLCRSLGYPTDADSADLPTAALVTATGSPSAVQTTISPTAAVSSRPALASSTTSHAKPLSVPAIAGIAAGAAFLVALVITALVFLYIRRKSQGEVVIVDSEKRSKPYNDGRPATSETTRGRPVSSRRSALFTLEPPSPPHKDAKPLVLQKEVASTATLESPAPTLTNNSFTWYNKKEAELSTTSLISVPRNLHTPVPKSPAVTEFSDQASIYSATESDVSEESSPPPSIIAEPPTAVTNKRQSRVVVSQHIFNPPKVSFSQPRPSTSHSTAGRPPRLDMSKIHNHEEIELDEGNSDRRRALNPLGQNPSPNPRLSARNSMAFNFEIPSPASHQGFGDSFMNMNDFDKWKDRR